MSAMSAMSALRAAWSVGALIVFAAAAQAQDTEPAPKKPAADQPGWAASIVHHDDSISGTRMTVIKRELGQGWAVGGQMTQTDGDLKADGNGPPNMMPDRVQRSTIFGPYLEKRF